MIHPNWNLIAWGVDDTGTVNGECQLAMPPFSFQGCISGEYLCIYISHRDRCSRPVLHLLFDHEFQSLFQFYQQPNLRHQYRCVLLVIYGLGSHTAKLGAVVAILGCGLVLAKFAIGLIVRVDKGFFHNLFLGTLIQALPQLIVDIANQPEEIVKKKFHMEDGKWPEFQFRS